MPAQTVIKIHQATEILSFLIESDFFRLIDPSRPRSRSSDALHPSNHTLWLEEFVCQGRPFVPPFLIADLAELIMVKNDARQKPEEAPPKQMELRQRYVRAFGDFRRLQKFQSVFTFEGVNAPALAKELLHILAEAMQSRLSLVPGFSIPVTREVISGDFPGSHTTLSQGMQDLWESYIRAFEMVVADWMRDESAEAGPLEMDMQALRLHAFMVNPDSPISWDYESISHTLEGLRHPVISLEQKRLWSRMPLFHVERVRITSQRPEGGYIGLRQNGGIEQFGSIAPSELALPEPMLLDRAFNRRLTVFERPVERVQMEKAALCVIFDDTRKTIRSDRLGSRSSAAVLVRALHELASVIHEQSGTGLPVLLISPKASETIHLGDLKNRPRQLPLPFFCDETRSSCLANMYCMPLVEPTPLPFAEQVAALHRCREDHDSMIVLSIGPQSDYLNEAAAEVTSTAASDRSWKLLSVRATHDRFEIHSNEGAENASGLDEAAAIEATLRFVIEHLFKIRLREGQESGKRN